MTTINAQIPDALARQVEEVVQRHHLSISQFIHLALQRGVEDWSRHATMEERAARADMAAFERILAKVPDVPPEPGDELPPGWAPHTDR